MNNLQRAKTLLTGDCTCAVVGDGQEFVSLCSGVAPLLQLLEEGRDVSNHSAADRVVGKAAALLYVLLGVSEVYADVMSAAAQEVFRSHGIACSCETLTERIEGRAGDGFCPMETAVWDISDPAEGLHAIRQKLAEMRK